MSSDLEEQQDELLALLSIFDPDEFVRKESKFSGEFRVCVELPQHFTVKLTEGDRLSQHEVSSLPPLHLTFDLPEDYPSASAPSYSLTCCWLSLKQLSSLCAQLDGLYQSTGGAVVLFSWAQFLKQETLDFLGIRDVLEIPSDEEDGSASSEAEGASCLSRLTEQTPAPLLLSRLLIHDAAQRAKAFSSQHFDCGVCFCTWRGEHCVQLIHCGHVFCRSCLTEFWKGQINEGNVKKVICLQTSCTAAPTHAQVRSLVGEELFGRYDRLLLQSSKASIPAVSLSGTEVEEEEESDELQLPNSRPQANSDHESEEEEPVTHRIKPHKKMPKSKEGMMRLWEDYCTGTRAHRRLLEDRYGRHKLLGFLENRLSQDWLDLNSKSCPHCSTHIERIGGCNHMTCKGCYLQFCWLCLGTLPYCCCPK